MHMNRLLYINNYIARIIKYKKRIMTQLLSHKIHDTTNINSIMSSDSVHSFNADVSLDNKYIIFGETIDLESPINWHQDRMSEFIYPYKRYDKIHPKQWFDKGIELVFPWEFSRFYFSISLAQKYLVTRDIKYFELFKTLILDWIKNNEFLIGINWYSTMDVSIRAVNWIVALNIFRIFIDDNDFEKILSKAFAQHAEYISKFPLIESNGLTTNHTIAAYAGLLFLALTLRSHPRSKRWIRQSIHGLESTIREQIYVDGSDFEGSIQYHRLVLEIYSYSAIFGAANGIIFSNYFYHRLFRMYEYTASYIDKKGNAPQIGDNDSGRFIAFNAYDNNIYSNELKHTYLLYLGSIIFGHKFSSLVENTEYKHIVIPSIPKVSLPTNDFKQQQVKGTIAFRNAGAYFLKNSDYDLCVACFPLGQKGKGGHNHQDMGSFTLSINGKQFAVDPGSYCYSKNRKVRDKFRSYHYHNTLYTKIDIEQDLARNGYWSLAPVYRAKNICINNANITITIQHVNDHNARSRCFELKEDKLIIRDIYPGFFCSRINLHPDCKDIIVDNKNQKITVNKRINIHSDAIKVYIQDYDYAPHYGKKVKSKAVIFEAVNSLIVSIYTIL